jgi:hypothetical protein
MEWNGMALQVMTSLHTLTDLISLIDLTKMAPMSARVRDVMTPARSYVFMFASRFRRRFGPLAREGWNYFLFHCFILCDILLTRIT